MDTAEFFMKKVRDPTALVAAAGFLIALAGYRYYTCTFNYWQRRGIPGEKGLGMIYEMFTILFGNRVAQAIERTKKFGKVYGVFYNGNPRLVVADPEVLQQVAIKDFDCFQNHTLNQWANKLQRNFLVWLQGDHWKRVRAMISPHFTSSKIKRMYKLLDACAEDLLENYREHIISARRDGERAAKVDLYSIYSLYTMDGITSCCYGLKLQRERGDTDIAKASARNTLVRDCNQVFQFNIWRLAIVALLPRSLLKAFGFEMLPEERIMPLTKRVEKLLEGRRQGNAATKYDDILQMLVNAKLDDEMELGELDQAENHHAGLTRDSLLSDQNQLKSGLKGESANGKQHKALATKLTDIEIISNALFLLAAGLDTTRASMSTITYFLAHHQDVQDKLYEELQKIAIMEDTPVGYHIKFDYDALTSCLYLDAVISESFRIFGPVSYTERIALRDYYIEKYDVKVSKGTTVMLGIHSVANDPEYWEKPEQFDPDRFMPGRKEKIVPGSYAPFGLGPRHCVGMRFSLTETKLGLAKVLMSYKFAPAPGTKYPPEPSMGISLVKIKNCKVLVTYRDEANF